MAISNLPKLNFSVPFAMTAALPLEYNAYFSTLAEAQAAAQTAEAPGSTNTVYYFGQKIVVVTDSSADLYIIQPDKTLKEAGAVPVGDGKSITVSDAGVIGIVGFDAAIANQQPRKKADGTIEWYTPDTSTVAGLQETVGQHTTQIAGLEGDVATINGQIETINGTLETKANSADVYTKTQTDDKIKASISAVYKPAGSVAFVGLPTPSKDVLGNIYNVTDGFTTNDNFVEGAGKKYPAGTNVAVVSPAENTYKFDVLSGEIDLSDYQTSEQISQTYATKNELTTGLAGKVDKVEGSRLMTNAEGTKLAGIAEGAQVNVIDKVSAEFTIGEGKELGVAAIEMTKVTGLADALGNKVDKETGKGLSSNDFTDALLNKLNAVADGAQVNVIDSVSDEFEVSADKQLSVKAIASDKITGLQGALDTKLEQVKVAGTALTITDKAVDIPAATAALLGVVKVDDVTIGSADGVISVKAVSTDLFQQGTDTLIWNGGTAQG